jgi:nucleotide-binding universal stress UspA family protein
MMTATEVLVGLDGSASAKAALDWAARYARGTHLPLRAVHVLVDLYTPKVASTAVLVTEYTRDEEAEELAKDGMRRLFASVDPEPTWHLEFAEGLIAPELVERAARAQLLVVGTREHTGIGRLVNGSVSHYCLKHAPCPVVAVPGGAEGPGVRRVDRAPAFVAP